MAPPQCLYSAGYIEGVGLRKSMVSRAHGFLESGVTQMSDKKKLCSV